MNIRYVLVTGKNIEDYKKVTNEKEVKKILSQNLNYYNIYDDNKIIGVISLHKLYCEVLEEFKNLGIEKNLLEKLLISENLSCIKNKSFINNEITIKLGNDEELEKQYEYYFDIFKSTGFNLLVDYKRHKLYVKLNEIVSSLLANGPEELNTKKVFSYYLEFEKNKKEISKKEAYKFLAEKLMVDGDYEDWFIKGIFNANVSVPKYTDLCVKNNTVKSFTQIIVNYNDENLIKKIENIPDVEKIHIVNYYMKQGNNEKVKDILLEGVEIPGKYVDDLTKNIIPIFSKEELKKINRKTNLNQLTLLTNSTENSKLDEKDIFEEIEKLKDSKEKREIEVVKELCDLIIKYGSKESIKKLINIKYSNKVKLLDYFIKVNDRKNIIDSVKKIKNDESDKILDEEYKKNVSKTLLELFPVNVIAENYTNKIFNLYTILYTYHNKDKQRVIEFVTLLSDYTELNSNEKSIVFNILKLNLNSKEILEIYNKKTMEIRDILNYYIDLQTNKELIKKFINVLARSGKLEKENLTKLILEYSDTETLIEYAKLGLLDNNILSNKIASSNNIEYIKKILEIEGTKKDLLTNIALELYLEKYDVPIVKIVALQEFPNKFKGYSEESYCRAIVNLQQKNSSMNYIKKFLDKVNVQTLFDVASKLQAAESLYYIAEYIDNLEENNLVSLDTIGEAIIKTYKISVITKFATTFNIDINKYAIAIIMISNQRYIKNNNSEKYLSYIFSQDNLDKERITRILLENYDENYREILYDIFTKYGISESNYNNGLRKYGNNTYYTNDEFNMYDNYIDEMYEGKGQR